MTLLQFSLGDIYSGKILLKLCSDNATDSQSMPEIFDQWSQKNFAAWKPLSNHLNKYIRQRSLSSPTHPRPQYYFFNHVLPDDAGLPTLVHVQLVIFAVVWMLTILFVVWAITEVPWTSFAGYGRQRGLQTPVSTPLLDIEEQCAEGMRKQSGMTEV
jgi:hypothetical protein